MPIFQQMQQQIVSLPEIQREKIPSDKLASKDLMSSKVENLKS
eukprot:CAMPEP_0170558106 /NCGR_PEP_ID=MMETSP0211-20121228/32711_1 /TAXON_ID=311385 /ORGANISM="Pseudokeronopsis sp., Strain OXSARD2" /LENGTH=42 /DNA_ID= /DNA_START= /DNA_END= /DNA_ORIENTATION=